MPGKQDRSWMASVGCGSPQDTIRVDSRGKIRRTHMAKDCLYCGLQFSDTTNFCPDCGRLTEKGFKIRPMQEYELDRLHREMKEKDDLIRQLVLVLSRRYGEGKPERVILQTEGRNYTKDATSVYSGI